MEIETAPSPPASTPWGRVVLLLVLLGPVTLLVLLPVGLGLERYVMSGSSMTGSLDRGSIAFERVVPVSDLRVGDVVTYRHPEAGDEDAMITHRIVAIQPDGLRTRGDAEESADAWLVRPESPTMSRVEFSVPWIGWAYLLLLDPKAWALLVAASGLVLLALMTRRLRHPPAGPRVPVPKATQEATP